MSENKKRSSDVRYKQRAVIEFFTREGVLPKAIHSRLEAVYGAQVFDISTVRYWARESKKKLIEMKDADRPGRPKSSNTPELAEKINQKIRENHFLVDCQVKELIQTRTLLPWQP